MSIKTQITIATQGKLIFSGNAHIGHGSKIVTHGECLLGNEFAISSNANIYCYSSIEFGDNCLLGWDVLVMDSDSHPIFDEDGNQLSLTKPIKIGNKVWLCYESTVLKGTTIPDNCIIGAKSLVVGNKFSPNTIITGSPAKSKKIISSWKI